MEKIDAKVLEEAKRRIAEEFMDRYHQFLEEVPNGETIQFGMKYGVMLTDEGVKSYSKDTMKTMLWFQQNIFTGRYIQNWEKAGYSRQIIWALSRDGFLANKQYSNSYARATGTTSWYFIPQRTAKEIYKGLYTV